MAAYVYGLDSSGIASNGDENVYIRIARLTAESGHLLPLQIDMPKFRNTKPPLLFWQAIASTGAGGQWTLWRLRLPSVIYTMMTAALIAALARRYAGRWETGLLAALAYLGFYNTFRYGRPLLTDPPEVFWLTLTAVATLAWRPASLASALVAPLCAGVAVGIACLYKSFALILPAGLVLAGWHLEAGRGNILAAVRAAVPRLILTATAALAIFSLWFIADPDPGAIWRDFVIGQNVGKFDRGGYFHDLVIGGSSIPMLLLALAANGGLLAPVLIALIVDAWRRRCALSPPERLLWIWVIGYFLAFSLPSQRSGRYLLPAMPALAILAALAWPRLTRAGFLVTAVLGMLLGALIAALSFEIARELGGGLGFPWGYWALLGTAICLGAASILRPRLAPDTVLPISILLLFATGVFVRAYDAPPGPFAPATRDALRGKSVWVPCEFAAAEEGHRFLLPGADVRGYRQNDRLGPADLAARYPLFAIYVPLGAPAGCDGCTLLGARYLMRGRHAGNAWADLTRGELIHDLFSRELLFQSARAPAAQAATLGCGA